LLGLNEQYYAKAGSSLELAELNLCYFY
jgi:hypothetical protein